jgi:hypothetical protein
MPCTAASNAIGGTAAVPIWMTTSGRYGSTACEILPTRLSVVAPIRKHQKKRTARRWFFAATSVRVGVLSMPGSGRGVAHRADGHCGISTGMVAQPGQVLLDVAQLDAPRLGVEQVHGNQLGALDHALAPTVARRGPAGPETPAVRPVQRSGGPWSGVLYPADEPEIGCVPML